MTPSGQNESEARSIAQEAFPDDAEAREAVYVMAGRILALEAGLADALRLLERFGGKVGDRQFEEGRVRIAELRRLVDDG